MSKIPLPWASTIREALRGNEHCSREIATKVGSLSWRHSPSSKSRMIAQNERNHKVLMLKLADAVSAENSKQLTWRTG